ncbi:hypothetical protein GCK72_010207 [Caenorhabditis remanei]|uniref:Uncharacterized protein n=1 Tax=Caenorhabditis remanei TaxID=31234 RepID=A0A6A5H2N0_CAERE|nr:hypothetical protein GCK72_010207 [Caenorhabditis remanei]KAF1761948.1 hypothetical protein GCK72_010207 [Caenorhabditis remanei]
MDLVKFLVFEEFVLKSERLLFALRPFLEIEIHYNIVPGIPYQLTSLTEFVGGGTGTVFPVIIGDGAAGWARDGAGELTDTGVEGTGVVVDRPAATELYGIPGGGGAVEAEFKYLMSVFASSPLSLSHP